MDYDSEPGDNVSKHSFKHDFDVGFSGSGTTDGGLEFGAGAGFDDEGHGHVSESSIDEGTVWVSSPFGKITFGANDSADKLSGGIADVGLFDVGVDDVAEDIYGTTPNQFRYDQGFGNIKLAISAGTQRAVEGTAGSLDLAGHGATDQVAYWSVNPNRVTGGTFGKKKNGYAIGMSFSASGATVGLGYDSNKAVSIGLGHSTGQISANAFWAKRDRGYMHNGSDGLPAGDARAVASAIKDGTYTAGYNGLGVDLSYAMGASKLTLAYARTRIDGIQPVFDLAGGGSGYRSPGTTSGSVADTVSFASVNFKGVGIGFEHDLGGGAKLVAGFAQVPQRTVDSLSAADFGPVGTGRRAWTASRPATGRMPCPGRQRRRTVRS